MLIQGGQEKDIRWWVVISFMREKIESLSLSRLGSLVIVGLFIEFHHSISMEQ